MHSGVYLNFIGELDVTWGCPGVAKRRMLCHRGASSVWSQKRSSRFPFPRGDISTRPISPHFSVGSNIFLSFLLAMNKLFPTLNIWAFSPNGSTAIKGPGTWNDRRMIDLDQRVRFQRNEFRITCISFYLQKKKTNKQKKKKVLLYYNSNINESIIFQRYKCPRFVTHIKRILKNEV